MGEIISRWKDQGTMHEYGDHEHGQDPEMTGSALQAQGEGKVKR